MISSIIATNETLCYLLEQFARSRGRDEDTRYCATARGMVNSTLYGKSRRRLFAQGKCYVTLSNICAQGQKPGIVRTHTGQYAGAAPAPSRPHGRPAPSAESRRHGP
jgi:hypothetical protein